MIDQVKTSTIALFFAAVSVVLGLMAFALSWHFWSFWGGPMPGSQLLLFPGHLTLVYFWHPLLTEEISFWPKLMLQMAGQFLLVAAAVAVFTTISRRCRRAIARYQRR